jgi:hypothetical protein
MTSDSNWLKTPDAAMALGCSQNHLKRNRDTHGGILIGGIHYCLGTSRSAPITWNVAEIRKTWHQQGMMRTQMANRIINELQAR